jgi:hypothetical protein
MTEGVVDGVEGLLCVHEKGKEEGLDGEVGVELLVHPVDVAVHLPPCNKELLLGANETLYGGCDGDHRGTLSVLLMLIALIRQCASARIAIRQNMSARRHDPSAD